MKILLCLTGSVATVLYEKLIRQLQKVGDVSVILTEKSEAFLDFQKLCNVLEEGKNGHLYTDKDEWEWQRVDGYHCKWKKDDEVLHIKLRNEYNALVIAPCSANTLAKLANGICDNLLTCVARAWDVNRPVIVAPAMNTNMWEHPITYEHILAILRYKYKVVQPQKKMLACGTEGMGAMADISDIVGALQKELIWYYPFMEIFEDDGIPINGHPGAFATKRKNSTHTGVDLYANEGRIVVPVENGTVVGREPFTGPKDNSPWWLDTDCILVEGASGVVCYGEININSNISIGQRVYGGKTILGTVKRVIPNGIEHPEVMGWKPNMLHIELYPYGMYKASAGYEKDKGILQDPTSYLINAFNAPKNSFFI